MDGVVCIPKRYMYTMSKNRGIDENKKQSKPVIPTSDVEGTTFYLKNWARAKGRCALPSSPNPLKILLHSSELRSSSG